MPSAPNYGLLDCSCPIEWSHPLNLGLVSEWAVTPLSGWRGGNTFRDLARGHKANDGPITNAPAWVGPSSRRGGWGSLSFTAASSQYVAPATPTVATLFTVAYWIQASSVVGTTVTAWSDTGTSQIFILDHQGGAGVARYAAASATPNVIINGSTNVADGAWHHLAATWSSGNMVLYVDGLSQATGSSPSTTLGNVSGVAPQLYFGRYVNGAYYTGMLDGIVIYNNRVLTDAEIKALYQESRLGNPNRWRWIKSGARNSSQATSIAYSLSGTGGMALGSSLGAIAAYTPSLLGGTASGSGVTTLLSCISSLYGGSSVGSMVGSVGAYAPAASGGSADGSTGNAASVYSPTPSGGATDGSSSATAWARVEAGTGGAADGCQASLASAYVASPSGGDVTGSDASTTWVALAAGTGGSANGSSVTAAWTASPAPSGGIADGSGASLSSAYAPVISGGPVNGSAASTVWAAHASGTGGAVDGSLADVSGSAQFTLSGTGGSVAGSVGGLIFACTIAPYGGVADGSTSTIAAVANWLAAGGTVIGSASPALLASGITASGGSVLGSSPTVTISGSATAAYYFRAFVLARRG